MNHAYSIYAQNGEGVQQEAYACIKEGEWSKQCVRTFICIQS